MRRIATLLIAGLLAGTAFSQNILFVDYNNAYSSDQQTFGSKVYTYLNGSRPLVNRVAAIPGAISNVTYNQVWIYGNPGVVSPANINPILAFIRNGGGVYIQSEVSCCPNQAAFAKAIMDSLTFAGPSIVHNPTKFGRYYYSHNIQCCPQWTTQGFALRPFTGVPAANVLFTVQSNCGGGSQYTNDIAAVMFGSCHMTNGQGAFIVTGDFDMFYPDPPCSSNITVAPLDARPVDLIADLLLSLPNNCQTSCSVTTPMVINDTSICSGGTVTINSPITGGGYTYLWSTGGTGTSENIGTSGQHWLQVTVGPGCVLTDTFNVTVGATVTSTVNPTICQGQSYFAGGANQTTTGTYYDTLQAASGCDSVVTTNLAVVNVINNAVNPTICQGQTYWAGGANQSTSGTYVDTLLSAAGCDSVVTTNLIVTPSVTSNSSVSICQGQVAVIHGQNQSIAGMYADTLVGANGCDSISNITLVVNPTQTSSQSFTICENDSVQINGVYYSSATNFSVNYSSSQGCDSIVTYDVAAIAKPLINLGPDVEECDGNTVSLGIGPLPTGFEFTWWNGSQAPVQLVTESGDYWVTVTHPLCYNIQDSVTVSFKDCSFYIYVPNAFTPNGDPFNAGFRPKYYGELEEYEMLIFDRWGELLFTTDDPMTSWDGTISGNPAKEDVYVYRLNYKSKYEEKKTVIGKVTLLR